MISVYQHLINHATGRRNCFSIFLSNSQNEYKVRYTMYNVHSMLKIMFDKEIRPAQNSRNSLESNKTIEFHWSAHNFDLEVFSG